MISTDHYAALKRLLCQPTIKRPDVRGIVARVHEVAGMDQNVPVGKPLDSIVKTMGVRDYDEAHFRSSTCLNVSASNASFMFDMHGVTPAPCGSSMLP